MATITLIADTNYSALTVANDDTIDCAGFVLTLDVAPTETGIQVTTPGTAGTVVFSGGWVIPTWDFYAGTVPMIVTLPADAEIGISQGGTEANASGCTTNNGIIGTANGGSGNHARGVNINNGTVTTATPGSVANAHGVLTNNGTVTTANGGSIAQWTYGVNTNSGTVTTANGGSIANSNGVRFNNGTVTTANGGTHVNAYGIAVSYGICLRLTDDVGPAVNAWVGDTIFVEGPHVAGKIPDNIKTIYSLGTLSASATIAADATVTTLSEGASGAAFQLVGPGGLVY